jgi:phage tail-like protein
MTTTENNIIPSFHFRVVFTGLNGITAADTRFESVSGIQGCRLVETKENAKKNDRETSTTGFQPLVLKRAAMAPQASVLLQWVLQCLNTGIYTALPEVQVQVLDETQQPLLLIRLTQVTLKSWIMGGLDARASGILMEEFLLDYKAIEINTG